MKAKPETWTFDEQDHLKVLHSIRCQQAAVEAAARRVTERPKQSREGDHIMRHKVQTASGPK
jgi:hypothetical protein